MVKIGDADILHKTERSGVILGVQDAQGIRNATNQLRVTGARSVVIRPLPWQYP